MILALRTDSVIALHGIMGVVMGEYLINSINILPLVQTKTGILLIWEPEIVTVIQSAK